MHILHLARLMHLRDDKPRQDLCHEIRQYGELKERGEFGPVANQSYWDWLPPELQQYITGHTR